MIPIVVKGPQVCTDGINDGSLSLTLLSSIAFCYILPQAVFRAGYPCHLI